MFSRFCSLTVTCSTITTAQGFTSSSVDGEPAGCGFKGLGVKAWGCCQLCRRGVVLDNWSKWQRSLKHPCIRHLTVYVCVCVGSLSRCDCLARVYLALEGANARVCFLTAPSQHGRWRRMVLCSKDTRTRLFRYTQRQETTTWQCRRCLILSCRFDGGGVSIAQPSHYNLPPLP